MPAHHSHTRKLIKAAARQKTRFCRFFLTEEGCANGGSCKFAHSQEELVVADAAPKFKSEFGYGTCGFSDDSTSICSDETFSMSVETSSICDSMDAPLARPRWADVTDEDDDELHYTWAPCQPLPIMREFSMAPMQSQQPPNVCAPKMAATSRLTKREKRATRENIVSEVNARRAALADAVLGQLLRQAQGPEVYED